MRQTEQMISAVVSRAEAHATTAMGVARASERQAAALREANSLVPSVEEAVEKALGAVRYVAFMYPLHGCLFSYTFGGSRCSAYNILAPAVLGVVLRGRWVFPRQGVVKIAYRRACTPRMYGLHTK